MKKILRRTLIAWWFIPASWIIIWPLVLLLTDRETACQILNELTDAAWNGII